MFLLALYHFQEDFHIKRHHAHLLTPMGREHKVKHISSSIFTPPGSIPGQILRLCFLTDSLLRQSVRYKIKIIIVNIQSENTEMGNGWKTNLSMH